MAALKICQTWSYFKLRVSFHHSITLRYLIFGSEQVKNCVVPFSSESSDDSASDKGDIFDSYPDKAKSDNILLIEYFAGRDRQGSQLEIARECRGKHQSDMTLLLDYKFNLKLYKTLLDHHWQVGAPLDNFLLYYVEMWVEQ